VWRDKKETEIRTDRQAQEAAEIIHKDVNVTRKKLSPFHLSKLYF
jgi:hypothetical protein